MPSFTLTEAKEHHCGQMIRHLRLAHRNAMLALGGDMHAQLRTCFDASSYRKAWFIDGKLAGLGGVMGTQMSSAGYLWLAFTNNATLYPVALMKMVREQLDEIMQTHRMLITGVLQDDPAALRFADHMGFQKDRESNEIGYSVWIKRQPSMVASLLYGDESYVSNENTTRIPADEWRRQNMGIA